MSKTKINEVVFPLALAQQQANAGHVRELCKGGGFPMVSAKEPGWKLVDAGGNPIPGVAPDFHTGLVDAPDVFIDHNHQHIVLRTKVGTNDA